MIGTLKAGDLALYNQQVLHCGSANESPRSRPAAVLRLFQGQECAQSRRHSCRGQGEHAAGAFQNKLTLGDILAELRALDGPVRSVEGRPDERGIFEELDLIDATEVREPAADGADA